MSDIAKKFYNDGMEEMRLIVFRNARLKGICESVAAEIAEIPPKDIERYCSLIKQSGES